MTDKSCRQNTGRWGGVDESRLTQTSAFFPLLTAWSGGEGKAEPQKGSELSTPPPLESCCVNAAENTTLLKL